MATPLNGSIVNGFEILQLFSEHRPDIDTALVSKKLEMNNATAHNADDVGTCWCLATHPPWRVCAWTGDGAVGHAGRTA